MNKRRKEKLDQRARQYAHAREHLDDRWSRAFFGFQDGYRAAMSDMRKALKAASAEHYTMSYRALLGRDSAIRNFLLPLR